ncbi:MAG: hypothetical protein ACNI3A_14775 [Desulfovibrio sp.]|uniref:hypothetical protein n=1 Tax=Desulfovibrio sp. 7SRBS1 TaxID=3378064 RepID=UPI003B3C5277
MSTKSCGRIIGFPCQLKAGGQHKGSEYGTQIVRWLLKTSDASYASFKVRFLGLKPGKLAVLIAFIGCFALENKSALSRHFFQSKRGRERLSREGVIHKMYGVLCMLSCVCF